VNGATFTLGSTAGAVSATVSYSDAARTATFDPTSSLEPATVYTATLDGGADGISDVAGNELAADVTWTFTTATGASPPGSGWTYVGTGTLASSTGATLSVPYPTRVTAGDLLLLGCQGRNNAMNWSSPGYSTLVAPAGPGGLRFELLSRWALGGESGSVSITNASGTNGWSCSLTVLRGGPGSGDPLAAPVATQIGSSRTMTAPALPSVPAGSMVVRWFASSDDNNHGTPSEGTVAFGGTAYNSVTGVGHASSMSFVVSATAGSRTSTTMLQNANFADPFIGVSVALTP